MSEKTLGQIAKYTFNKVGIDNIGRLPENREDPWQAAADAIAAPLLARIAELEGEVVGLKAWKAGAYIGQEDNEEEAYQRGIAEGMERARNLMEANGMEWAAGKIAKAIRSASPAVDVTSDKGEEP